MGRLSILFKNLRVKVVTEKYPYEPVELPPGFRGKPVIDVTKCIGCGACVSVCPPNALSLEEHLDKGYRVIRLFIGRCIFCARCQDVCPTNAIKLTNEFELSTHSIEDLYEEVKLILVKCIVCGKPFTTYRELMEVASKLPKHQRKLLLVCPKCKESISSYFISYARR